MTAEVFPISPGPNGARLEYECGRASLVYTERSPDPWYSDTETDIPLNTDQISEMIAWLQGVQADLVQPWG